MRNPYEETLRRILFHSADVAPEMVQRYLSRLSSKRHYPGREQAIKKDFGPLVRAIPGEYTDFALNVFVTEGRRDERGWDLELPTFGVDREVDLYPPTSFQGPFFLLLSSNEAEGLRLVHGVTNAAADEWVRRVRLGTTIRAGRLPLPQRIKLPSGSREFWGDEGVYLWFRPNSNSPHAVSCALMALEVWMEGELANGRDAAELFSSVLSGSSCIAVPGLCLGIALGAPQLCFEAALPLLATPALWRFEIPRFVADQRPAFDVSFLGRHRTEQQFRAARDRAPQRKREIRNLAATYLLLPDPTKVAAFRAATDRLITDLPFCFEDERGDPKSVTTVREQMERFHACCDPANYHVEDRGSHAVVTLVPPPALVERDASARAKLSETNASLSLAMWAFRTLEEGKIDARMTVEEALQQARRLESSEDSAAFVQGIGLLDYRRLAIVGVAAASIVADIEAVRRQAGVDWCRETLLAASAAASTMDLSEPSGSSLFDPLVAAALGLAALVRHGEVRPAAAAGRISRFFRSILKLLSPLTVLLTPEGRDRASGAIVRDRLIRLVAVPNPSVSSAVLRGLASLWESEPALLWHGLELSLAIAVRPRRGRQLWEQYESAEGERLEGLIQNAIAASHVPARWDLPRVQPSSNESLDTERVAASLQALPLERMVALREARAAILGLLDGLMEWTIQANTKDESSRLSSQRPDEWNDAFLEWAAGFCALLDPTEVEHHVLARVRGAWSAAPWLTADLQRGYLKQRISVLGTLSEAAVSEWEAICSWVLESPVVATIHQRSHPHPDLSRAVSLVVYVSFGGPALINTWPHARRFQTLTEKWVGLVAQDPQAFSSLVTFLAGPGGCFLPEPALRWLQSAAERAEDVSVTVGADGNGHALAQLLRRLWSESGRAIQRDPESLRRFAYLVDQLVAVGIPLASRLQVELNERP